MKKLFATLVLMVASASVAANCQIAGQWHAYNATQHCILIIDSNGAIMPRSACFTPLTLESHFTDGNAAIDAYRNVTGRIGRDKIGGHMSADCNVIAGLWFGGGGTIGGNLLMVRN